MQYMQRIICITRVYNIILYDIKIKYSIPRYYGNNFRKSKTPCKILYGISLFFFLTHFKILLFNVSIMNENRRNTVFI